MNVSVTPELEQFVQDLVASGRYSSASEVFRDGLRLLEQDERRRLMEKWLLEGLTQEEKAQLPEELREKLRSQLNAKIKDGLDSLDRGEMVDGEKYFATWKDRMKERKAASNAVSSKSGRKA